MSDFTNFIGDIKDWVLHKEYTNNLTTTFIRMAETTLNQSLRVVEMTKTVEQDIIDGILTMPGDWIETDRIRLQSGKPLHFRSYDEFYSAARPDRDWYTMDGNVMVFGSTEDPLSIKMTYFAQIPTFTDVGTWLYTKYYNIFLQSSCAAAAMYAQEYDRASGINDFTSGLVEAANNTYRRAKTSGSLLTMARPRRIG